MSNTITTDYGDLIGFYPDLFKSFEADFTEAVKEKDWERVEELTEISKLLDDYEENDNLLVISENNGMGWTVMPYKPSEA